MLGGAAGVTPLECLAPVLCEPREPIGIDPIRADLERVAAAARDQHPVAENLAKPRNVDLNGLGGRVRRAIAPELIDHAVDRNDLAAMKQQDREHRPLPGPSERHRLPVD